MSANRADRVERDAKPLTVRQWMRVPFRLIVTVLSQLYEVTLD
jgi:hypothetical protein